MQAIPGLDLKRVDENATKAFQKIAEGRLTDYLRGLKIQHHNELMKVARLRNEADQAEARAAEIGRQIAAIVGGDWSAVAPMELQDKGDKP